MVHRLIAVLVGAVVAGQPLAATPTGSPPATGVHEAAPPRAAEQAVCQPDFDVDGVPRRTGTAFFVRTRAARPSVLAISAHHLLGLRSGQLPWREAPLHVSGARCVSLSEARAYSLGRAFTIRDAHMLGDLNTLNDIAIFPVMKSPEPAAPTALDLSDAAPRLGQRIWLVARTRGQPKEGDFLHKARVVTSSGYLGYVFEDAGLNTADTSGAPIVDDDGQVVGVNVGAGRTTSGAVFGVADTVSTLRAALSQGLAQAGGAKPG